MNLLSNTIYRIILYVYILCPQIKQKKIKKQEKQEKIFLLLIRKIVEIEIEICSNIEKEKVKGKANGLCLVGVVL
jgi:hypothetical protein